jgi:hypothetical protein
MYVFSYVRYLVSLCFTLFWCQKWRSSIAIAIDDKLGENAVKNLLPLRRWKRYPNTLNSNTGSRIRKWSKDQLYALQVRREPLHTLSEDEENVIQELLYRLVFVKSSSSLSLKTYQRIASVSI